MEKKLNLGRLGELTGMFFVALALVSCTTTEPVSTQHSLPGKWENKSPPGILASLKRGQEMLTDFSAVFSLSVDPPPRSGFSNLNGVIVVANRPEGRRIRVKGLGPFGRLLFDLVREGSDIKIYIPSEHTLYRGAVGQERARQDSWQRIFPEMFGNLSRAKTKEGATLRFRDGKVILPLKEGELVLDGDTGHVKEWRNNGRIISYNDYKKFPGLPPIPMMIRLEAEEKSRHVVCRLSQIHPLSGKKSGKFDFSEYDIRSFRKLNELSD